MNGTEAKQSAGYFKEKAVIGLSALTGDEIDKGIMKVTSHMLKAPKEKYMQKLVAASYGQYGSRTKDGVSPNEYIVRELEKRTHTHNWIIVLKAVVALHRLLCDASDDMVEIICLFNNIFNRSHLKNIAETSDSLGQAYFIADYMTYLDHRCAMQTALGKCRRIEIPEFEEYLKSLNAQTLQPVFEAMLQLLEALSAVHYNEVIVNNYCTMEAYQLLIRDGKKLFQHLSKRIIYILDGFGDMTILLKKRWYELFKRYSSAFTSLKAFFDSMLRSSRVFVEPVPQLKVLPPSLAQRLENDIRASMAPEEKPCTLESLGIQSAEDKRVKAKEEKIPTPVPELPKSAPPKPVVPAFSMDDLFAPAPEPPKPLPSTTAASSSPPWVMQGPVPTAQSPSVEAQWCGGAPAEWSTGAPQEWNTGAPSSGPSSEAQCPPPQFQGLYAIPATTPPAEPQTATHRSSTQKPADPFRDLYTQSHQSFN